VDGFRKRHLLSGSPTLTFSVTVSSEASSLADWTGSENVGLVVPLDTEGLILPNALSDKSELDVVELREGQERSHNGGVRYNSHI
jgi:hypothetical protein